MPADCLKKSEFPLKYDQGGEKMSNLCSCGNHGELEGHAIAFQSEAGVQKYVGLVKGSVCYSCIKKKLQGLSKAGTVVSGVGALMFGSLVVICFKYSVGAAITFILFFLGMLAGLLFAIRDLVKISEKCRNKVMDEDILTASDKLVCRDLHKQKQIPDENIMLNHEALLEQNKLGQMVFAWSTSKTEEEQGRIIGSFLSQCKKEPFSPKLYPLAYSPLSNLKVHAQYSTDESLRFLYVAYNAWLLTENASDGEKAAE